MTAIETLLAAIYAYAMLPDGDEGKQAKLEAKHAMDGALQGAIDAAKAHHQRAIVAC
jgi:hypothetical protein